MNTENIPTQEPAKMGRPTKYSPALLAKAEYYVTHWEELGDQIPMICGLASYLNIDKKTIERWEKENQDEGDEKHDFCRVCARVRSLQERVLINKGLSRVSDASLSKLLLMKHGYSDRAEVDHTSGGQAITELKITMV